jgi:hypothetical protein
MASVRQYVALQAKCKTANERPVPTTYLTRFFNRLLNSNLYPQCFSLWTFLRTPHKSASIFPNNVHNDRCHSYVRRAHDESMKDLSLGQFLFQHTLQLLFFSQTTIIYLVYHVSWHTGIDPDIVLPNYETLDCPCASWLLHRGRKVHHSY